MLTVCYFRFTCTSGSQFCSECFRTMPFLALGLLWLKAMWWLLWRLARKRRWFVDCGELGTKQKSDRQKARTSPYLIMHYSQRQFSAYFLWDLSYSCINRVVSTRLLGNLPEIFLASHLSWTKWLKTTFLLLNMKYWRYLSFSSYITDITYNHIYIINIRIHTISFI